MTLAERDIKTIWHPFTQMKTANRPLPVVKAKGAELTLENGKVLIDANASWWVNLHGHSHPYISEKIGDQLKELEHVIFAGCTHRPAVEFAERILSLLPASQSKVFFSDNGSTAVEVAVKMALQFWENQGKPKRKIVALKNAFHGETFGAMSVSARGAFTKPFHSLLFEVHFIEVPSDGKEDRSKAELRAVLENEDIAAFIYEPLVQGAAGMNMYAAEALNELMQICKSNNVLTIADEVMTGFGRTGKLFASEFMTTTPDLMCFSKGLTGGTLPMGLTSCSEEIYAAFFSDDKLKTFFHGHSFTANPVGCAAALASLDLLLTEECQNQRGFINQSHREFARKLNSASFAENVRVQGTILAFDVKHEGKTNYFSNVRDRLNDFFLEHDVLIRPLGNVIYILPPYCITATQLEKVYSTVLKLEEIEAVR